MMLPVPLTLDVSEYAPHYGRYISLVSGADIVAVLKSQGQQLKDLLSGLSDEEANFRYAPEKWSIKQVLGHLMDTERIFSYRALRISRADKTPIEGFEQDDYVHHGPFEHCPFADMIAEYQGVRAATVSLFRALNHDEWLRRGIANQHEISVRALAYVIAGHELHHRRVLEEKYLSRLEHQPKNAAQSLAPGRA